MTHGKKENAAGHVCMYCGSEYGWISDYVQHNRPYPIGYYKDPGKYWVVRYKGGGQTASNPQHCMKTSKGTKCLNSPC